MTRHLVSSPRSLVLAPALLALLSGCYTAPMKPPPPKPVDVMVRAAVEKPFIDFEEFTGRLEAFKKVEIQSRVTGYLHKVNFREGSKVRKDDVLFEIDPRPYKADLDKADAAIVQSQARLSRLEGDVLRAKDLQRTQSISKEEFEKIRGDHAEALAAQKVSEASRATAKLFHDYTKVLSPIDGVAGRAMIDEGNLVRADATILTTVVTQDPIYAYFDVDERTWLRLGRLVQEGKIEATDASKRPVSMGVADEDNFPNVGFIDFEDNAVDPHTGTLRRRGVFKNPKRFLAPGMFVRVRFQVGTARVATHVAEQGVMTDQGQKYVYAVNDQNKVEYRKVKTGALLKDERVVEEGIQPGERIIVSGLQRVRPGSEVVPKLVVDPPAGKAHEITKTVGK